MITDVQNIEQLRERLRRRAAEPVTAEDLQRIVGRLAADVLLEVDGALASYRVLTELLGEPVVIQLQRPAG